MNDIDYNNLTRAEMMKKIQEYSFGIIEISEYLDTHPENQKAICLHKEYTKRYKDLMDKYQKIFGPLTINFPCNKWRWLNEAWPWERSEL